MACKLFGTDPAFYPYITNFWQGDYYDALY